MNLKNLLLLTLLFLLIEEVHADYVIETCITPDTCTKYEIYTHGNNDKVHMETLKRQKFQGVSGVVTVEDPGSCTLNAITNALRETHKGPAWCEVEETYTRGFRSSTVRSENELLLGSGIENRGEER